MSSEQSAFIANRNRNRPDLSNQRLIFLVVALVFVVGMLAVVYLSSDSATQPGSPLLQSLAIVGSTLLLVPFVFSAKKRGGRAVVPNRLFIVHVVASLVGVAFVCAHAFASFAGPPLLMLCALVALLVTGMIGRLVASRHMAATLGTKSATFVVQDARLKQRIARVIQEKQTLLATLDPQASEALFSVTTRHWLRSPVNACRYWALAREEATLMGARQSVSPLQAWWRVAHLLLAWGFLFGLIVHVIVVTFFAGYAAGDGAIYWWHITAW